MCLCGCQAAGCWGCGMALSNRDGDGEGFSVLVELYSQKQQLACLKKKKGRFFPLVSSLNGSFQPKNLCLSSCFLYLLNSNNVKFTLSAVRGSVVLHLFRPCPLRRKKYHFQIHNNKVLSAHKPNESTRAQL